MSPAARRPFRSVALFAALAYITTLPSHSHAADATALQLAPCSLPEVASPARCGTLAVAENPDKPRGRQLSLKVVVIPARNGKGTSDPVLFLSGGPGQAATRDAAWVAEILADINQERDLLFIDQRGTGESAPLACPLVDNADLAANLRDIFPPAAVKRCVRELKARADLTQYSLRHFARDIEAVRVALGYSSLNLFGFSYGTRASQIYMRTYPKSARTAFLGSVAPVDAQVLMEFSGAAEAALNATFDACAADTACHAAFPALRDEFAALLARLDSGKVVVAAPGSNDKTADEKVTLTRGRFAERLRGRLYSTENAAAIPWMLHQAHAGNWQPFVDDLFDFTRGMDAQLSMGLFFSITCNEDVAFMREADIRARVTSSTFGDGRVRSQQAACAQWPRYRVPDGYRDPLRTDVPTLLVSGEFDPATPAVLAARAASGYARHASLMLRGQGHSGWSDCIAERYARVLRQGTVEGIVDDCPAKARPPFKLEADPAAVASP